ncbi:Hypothetical predicted protein [Scomber scombrus]|uniref:Uncharacterized protein n=1 Tax=Scomber scombrus TaxID=13677 RepID=A0AAV1NX62_SCOSC
MGAVMAENCPFSVDSVLEFTGKLLELSFSSVLVIFDLFHEDTNEHQLQRNWEFSTHTLVWKDTTTVAGRTWKHESKHLDTEAVNLYSQKVIAGNM